MVPVFKLGNSERGYGLWQGGGGWCEGVLRVGEKFLSAAYVLSVPHSPMLSSLSRTFSSRFNTTKHTHTPIHENTVLYIYRLSYIDRIFTYTHAYQRTLAVNKSMIRRASNFSV